MVDIDNNKLIGLLIISWGGLFLNQEHKQKRKEKAKTMGAILDKKDR